MVDTINNKNSPEQSCWECKYQKIAGSTFLGICTWFEQHGKGKNKEITPEVVDKGCKFFEAR